MGSWLLDEGKVGVIVGSVNGSSGTDAVLTSTDGAATLSSTDAASGEFILTFNHDFNAAPVAFVSCTDATFAATDGAHVGVVAAISTAAVTFRILDTGDNLTDGAAANVDFNFMVLGPRNR